jgi:hypothetical protein
MGQDLPAIKRDGRVTLQIRRSMEPVRPVLRNPKSQLASCWVSGMDVIVRYRLPSP